ncbi:MAG: hypothetical protein SFX73_06395 [Kofleriaceae bacterium]|nr:hypothetical protein [Kofleriaceae bacterium]
MLRIKLRYDDVEALAQRFAPNVGKSGLFVPTKSLQPVGAEVKFELRLANDTPVITGLGKVRAVRPADPENPRAAFGMAIELLRVTRESRDVILKLLERRKQLGLPEVAIPMPEDIDAVRKSDDTGVGSSPKEPPLLREPVVEGGALAFTSPRRPTAPLAVAKVHTIAALAPEPPRKRRAPVQELIESASGRIVAVMLPGLDEDVDVPAVLARARALAGGDLDAELDALRESAAAPIEITVEAASAELARQLGGKAVDRSARWATPPGVPLVAEGTPAPMPIVQLAQVTTAEAPAPRGEEPVSVVEEPAQIVEAAVPVVRAAAAVIEEPALVVEPAASDEEPTPIDALTLASNPVARDSAPALPVEPDQIADEIHRLDEADFEEVEHTHHGGEPQPEGDEVERRRLATEPSVADRERSLEQQLADVDDDELGISGGAATGTVELASAPAARPDRELDAEDAEEAEEVDDLEILAEADEADADLLAADAEADASAPHALAEPEPEPEPEPPTGAALAPAPRYSDLDFASRLALDDEDEDPPAPPPANELGLRSLAEIDPSTGELDPMMLSAAHAIAAFEHEPVAPPEPLLRPRRPSYRPQPQPAPQAESYDLETALEALDVDLDDLSFPHAKTEIPRKGPVQLPRKHPRAASEDGVLIDFDDDE